MKAVPSWRGRSETQGRKAWWILLVVTLLGATGTTPAQWDGRTDDVLEALPTGEVNWTTGRVRSWARADASRLEAAGSARQGVAFRAAVEATQQRLLDLLLHLTLDAQQSVAERIGEGIEKHRLLEALVREADLVQTRYLPRGVVETTLEVPMSGRYTALTWPVSTPSAALSTEAPEVVYTGVVIDARGLAVRPALFPKIVDEDGQEIYAPARVHLEAAVQRGYVVYVRTLDHAQVKARAGDHPLVIRAQRALSPARIDLLIRRMDADTIQHSAAIRLLLERCQVVIVA